MKRLALMLLAAITLILATSTDADARWFGRRNRTYSNVGYDSGLTYQIDTKKVHYDNTLSLQDIALMRAKWMAHTYDLSHGIHTYTPKCPRWQHPGASGEGIGMGGPKCATCIVGSVVVADAEVKAKNGTTYRVRLFR